MCFKKKQNEPVRLAKKENKKVIITPEMWVILVFIVIFIFAILFAWANKGAYFYNMELV